MVWHFWPSHASIFKVFVYFRCGTIIYTHTSKLLRLLRENPSKADLGTTTDPQIGFSAFLGSSLSHFPLQVI